MTSTCVYLVESCWYDSCRLLAAYDTQEAALQHAQAPAVVAEYGLSIQVREISVRTRLQFGKPHERGCPLPPPATIPFPSNSGQTNVSDRQTSPPIAP